MQHLVRLVSAAFLSAAVAVVAAGSLAPGASAHTPLPPGAPDFPGNDRAYHTYAEMERHIAERARDYSAIVRMFSIGKSYQGRELWAAKISDNVGTDEDEPEVLFDSLLHAREHMSLEMTLAILDWLTAGYVRAGTDGDRIRRIVDSREVWIVFALNPDGAEYDIFGDARDGWSNTYHNWRKTRQPTPGTSHVGTDLNRNHGYRWDCCGGSSDDPANIKYHGPQPYSEPEARAFRDFVNSRVVDGRQQIRVAASFHTSGRLVMWQYGYTKTDIPVDMTTEDHAALVAIGTRMAETTRLPDGTVYRPQQGSDLYITDGSSTMWLYGVHRVLAFTFELNAVRYQPASTIPSETGRNREGILHLLEHADCPWRAAGAGYAERDCGPLYDDLEGAWRWTANPSRTDTATAGRWQAGDPQGTSAADGTVVQPTTAVSGYRTLATGLASGGRSDANDVDGGSTTIRSGVFRIAESGSHWIRFRYAFAHDTLATSDDWLSVRLIAPGSVGVAPKVLAEYRAATGVKGRAVPGTWLTKSLIRTFQTGQPLQIEFEARDGGPDNVVEALIDDVRVYRVPATSPSLDGASSGRLPV